MAETLLAYYYLVGIVLSMNEHALSDFIIQLNSCFLNWKKKLTRNIFLNSNLQLKQYKTISFGNILKIIMENIREIIRYWHFSQLYWVRIDLNVKSGWFRNPRGRYFLFFTPFITVEINTFIFKENYRNK